MSINNFVSTVWANAILENLNDAAVYMNCVNRDYEGEIRGVGDTVQINSVGRVTIGTYTPNTWNITPEVLDGAGQKLTITEKNYFAFGIDDVDKAQMKSSVMAAAMKEAAWGLKDTADSFLATTIKASVATANTVGAVIVGEDGGDTTAYRLLVRAKRLMDDANTPKNDRWGVVPNWFQEELLLDPRFTGFGTSGNRATAMSGAVEDLLGFKLMFSNNVPVSGSEYSLLFGYKGAVTYAESVPEGQPEAYRPEGGFVDAVKGLYVYGAKVTRPSNLVLIPATQAETL